MDEARIIAWIDGELSPEEARVVAAAVAADPALAAHADRHRRQKARLAKAFGPLIDEAARMPAARAAPVVSLAAARARREAAKPAPPAKPRRHWGVPAAVAASLIVGIAVGLQVRPMPGIADRPGALALDSGLAGALQRQPSGAAGPVRIALSFRDRSGAWCRSFAADHLAGVACRGAGGWQLRYAVPAPVGGDALGQTIAVLAANPPADATTERRAIAAGWK